MAIILNEYEWAEKMILNKDLGRKPSETLSRVARYYYENRYSKREIRKLLDQFLIQCNPDASLFHWSDTLDRITKNAGKYQIIQIDSIPITEAELAVIKSIDAAPVQRLAFTLLCVSKYWDFVSPKNNHWVNSPDREIFSMANISASSKSQDLMYGKLLNAGLIKLSKKIDSLNMQVLFGDEVGDPVLHIRDFQNLGYQYMKYLGGPFFECKHCGKTVKMRERVQHHPRNRDKCRAGRGRNQQYCDACAAEIKTKQNIDAVVRKRKLAQ